MSGRHSAVIDAWVDEAHARPELDQWLAAMRDWALALDALDELGPLRPWRPFQLARASRLLRRCEQTRRVAGVERDRVRGMLGS